MAPPLDGAMYNHDAYEDICDGCDDLHLGMEIRGLRKQMNMTQTMLGDLCGYTDSHISRFENGEAIPESTIELEHIIEALRCSVVVTKKLQLAYICEVLRGRGICM